MGGKGGYMRIYDYDAYKWNKGVAASNLAKVDPQLLSELLDKNNIPWYSEGEPYTSGISVYCEDKELFKKLCNECKLTH